MVLVKLVALTLCLAAGDENRFLAKSSPTAISVTEKTEAARAICTELATDWNKRKPTEKSVTVASEVVNDVPMILGTVPMPDDKAVMLHIRWRQTADGIRLKSIDVSMDTKGTADEKKLRKMLETLRPWCERLGQKHLNEQDQKTLLKTFDEQLPYSAKTKGIRKADVGPYEASVGHLDKTLFVSLSVK